MEEEEKDENKKLTKSEERKQAREEKGVRKKDRAKRKRNEQKVEERQKKFINTDIYIVQDNTTMTEANDKPVYGFSYVPN